MKNTLNFAKALLGTQKGFAPILLILLVVVLIAGGAYLYNQNSSKETVAPEVKEENLNEIPKVNSVFTSTKKPIINNVLNQDTATTPIIKIISPNKEEVWNQNGEYTINWEYSDLNKSDEVIIGFRNSGQDVCWAGKEIVGNGLFKIIPNKVICDGSIKDLKSSGKYKVQIIVSKYSEGKGVADVSENYITITSN